MSGYLWFDIFAYIGMGCVMSAAILTAYIVGFDLRVRRRESRELREFNREIQALNRIWDRSLDV